MASESGTVLIIEDDPGTSRLQQRYLERAGYQVICAATAEEGIDKIANAGAELVLLDNRLPGNRTGLDVYMQLKSAGYEQPVIMVTGFSDEATVIQALRAGVRDFVTKSPEYLDYLPEAVGRALKAVRTERQLAQSEARLAGIIGSARDGILAVDSEQNIILFNAAAEQIFRRPAVEAIGRPVDLFLPSLAKAEVALGLSDQQGHKADWQTNRCEFHGLRANGVEFPVEVSISSAQADGQAFRIVIVRDITEKRQAETQFLRAQRMESLGVLAGGIAHDLNNVLTPILMAIEFLQAKLPGKENAPLLKTLHDSAQRGAEMVKQVLSFARGTEGQRLPVSLKHPAKECQRMLEHTLPKSIQLDFSFPHDLWLISADVTQISQVLMNLCVNARDAMPHGGRLTVTASNQTLDAPYAHMHADARPGPYVALSVSDTGTGIAPGILDRIFDPFFTTKKQGEGTGLGLSTVLGIVKSHGGFVHVETPVGKGTRFCVYLPAANATAAQLAAPEHTSPPRGQGELILVVDDEAAICEITKATLETHGYRVLTAHDGAEAVVVFLENRSDIKVVVTDMMMPVMDGPAAIRALRRMDAQVPIVAVSGLSASGRAARGQLRDVQAFLRKPYTADQLLRTLGQVLDPGGKCDGNGQGVNALDRSDGQESLAASYAGSQ